MTLERKPTQCATCPYMLPDEVGRCPLCYEDQHELMFVSTGSFDEAVCSCGWSSDMYSDGRGRAEADWKKHVAQVGTRPTGPKPLAGSVRSTSDAVTEGHAPASAVPKAGAQTTPPPSSHKHQEQGS